MRLFLFVLTLVTLVAAITHLPLLPSTPNAGLSAVETVPQRARVLGYERSEFGAGWASAGACTVREAALITLIDDSVLSTSCSVSGGQFIDPYTGEALSADDSIEIDHIFPLSAAWDLGAHSWTPQQRLHFANDPINLLATEASANRAKSDDLPATWMPPQHSNHCWYATRLSEVAAHYQLPLPAEDAAAMAQACRSWSLG